MTRNLLWLFLDDYGTGLDKEHVVAAGIAVKGEQSVEVASREHTALIQTDPRFGKKGRRWKADQDQVFSDYLVRQNLIPIAGVVRLDEEIRQLARGHHFPPRKSKPRAMRPFQAIWFILLTRVLANVVSSCLPRFGLVEHFRITVDRGNLREDQAAAYPKEVSRWTGEYSAHLVHETLSGVSPKNVAAYQGHCQWGEPNLSFSSGHPLLDVADGFTALASRYIREQEHAVRLVRFLDDTYRYRHPSGFRRSCVLDMTESVRTTLRSASGT